MQREHWRRKRSRRNGRWRRRGKKADLWWRRGSANGGDDTVIAAALLLAGNDPPPPSSPSSVFFFFCFFFPFLLLFSLFSSLHSSPISSPLSFYSLSSLIVSLSVFFFPSPSPVFIGKNRGGRRGWGGHCAVAPPLPLQHVESGLCRRLFEVIGGREVGAKQRRKENLLPLFSMRPGEEDDGVVQNGTVSGFFF